MFIVRYFFVYGLLLFCVRASRMIARMYGTIGAPYHDTLQRCCSAASPVTCLCANRVAARIAVTARDPDGDSIRHGIAVVRALNGATSATATTSIACSTRHW